MNKMPPSINRKCVDVFKTQYPHTYAGIYLWGQLKKVLAMAKLNKPRKPLVLLVEDNPIIQKVHFLKLEKLGCKVDIAATGIQALELYSNGYQLILLDCGLPDISGVEVGKRIRALERLHHLEPVPMVMVTAFNKTEELKKECQEAAIDALINKPVYAEELWQQILAHCKPAK